MPADAEQARKAAAEPEVHPRTAVAAEPHPDGAAEAPWWTAEAAQQQPEAVLAQRPQAGSDRYHRQLPPGRCLPWPEPAPWTLSVPPDRFPRDEPAG